MSARGVTTILLAGWALLHILLTVVAVVFLYEDFRPGDHMAMPAPVVSRVAAPTPTPTPRSPTAGELRALGLNALPSVSMPDDNPLTDEKVELGKMLFFDRRMLGSPAGPATSPTRAGATETRFRSATRARSTGATRRQSSTPRTRPSCSGEERRPAWRLRPSPPGQAISPATSIR